MLEVWKKYIKIIYESQMSSTHLKYASDVIIVKNKSSKSRW